MKGISLGVCAYKKPSATKARPMRNSSDCHDPASLATRSPPRRKNQSNWSSFGCSRLNPCKYTTKKWYFEAPAANILKPCQKSPEFSIAPEWRAPPAMQTCSSGKRPLTAQRRGTGIRPGTIAKEASPEWWSSPSLPPNIKSSLDCPIKTPLLVEPKHGKAPGSPSRPNKETRSNGRNDDKLHTLGNPLPVLGFAFSR